MTACSPQRFLPNSRNLFRTATLTPSSVLPVANQVERVPYRRRGTAQATLSGIYTGSEEANYEVRIVDTTVEIPRGSAPTFSGVGSGTVGSIAATGAQQTYTLTLSNAGTDTTSASVQLEGATITALVEGAGGNSIRISVDQSTLAFAASNFSTITDLPAGKGGPESPFVGAGYDWDSAVLDGNGLIPTSAPRIAFGDDRTAVYLAYKTFADGQWNYHTVPALARSIPRGTVIYTVTGGRTVSVTDGATTETTTAALPDGVKTAYDLLNWIRTESGFLVVDGVVANDRSPTGQGARELSLRTDAHAEVSYGNGSPFAAGFEDVTVASAAGTQLVTATCFATNSNDHPLAHLGSEKWNLRSSLLGDLGTITTGVAYREPAGQFGLTIPVRLPLGFGAPKGRFSLSSINYASGSTEPPICPAALTLGPDAVDQQITLVYKTRPPEDCECARMPAPNLNTSCLGNPAQGGGSMAYATDTIARLVSLHSWYTQLVRDMTSYGNAGGIGVQSASREADAISNPVDAQYYDTLNVVAAAQPYNGATYAKATESLRTLVGNFEATLAQVDPITPASPPGLREAGNTAWDAAVAEFQADIAGAIGSPSSYLMNVPSDRYDARLNFVLISAGIPTVGGADASTIQSGDGCWRDHGDAAWWVVHGSSKGEYGPLFTNQPYYSCRRANNGAAYFSTHEFALQLNVKCPELLLDGDTVVLNISESGWGATYQRGDVMELPIVASSPLYLTGGRTGDPLQTWNPNGSVSGALPAYLFDPTAPVAYSESGSGYSLAFLLTPGGIDWAQGDQFRWAVEGGHYEWRKNGGAWMDASPPRPIPLESDVIEEGLSITFTAGAAASFVTDDVYKFKARQPWAVSNTQLPSDDVWMWEGSGVEYAADFGSPQQIDLFAMLHGLPAGATVTLWGGVAAANEWSEAITYRPDAVWKAIDHAPRYVRIVITDAPDGWVQWPWAGVPLTTALAAEFVPTINYRINRGADDQQGGRYIGRGIGGDVVWSEALHDADIGWSEDDESGLREMFDELKRNDDEPFLFIPQVTRTGEPVIFARLGSDSLIFEDASGLNRNDGGARRWTVTMPLAPVYR